MVGVWGVVPVAGGADRWVYERSIRWQIQRGARGRIYSVAAGNGLLAMSGYGATGGKGEIVVVDPHDGTWKRTLQQHREVVQDLDFAPGNQTRMVSVDLGGRILLWEVNDTTGMWQHREVRPTDEQQWGNAVAKQLKNYRGFQNASFAGADYVVFPHLLDISKPIPTWGLRRIHLPTGRTDTLTSEDNHEAVITKIAATVDGRRIASADGRGFVYVWSNAPQPTATRLQLGSPALSMAWSADGNFLLVGTMRARDEQGRRGQASVEIWDARNARRVQQLPLSQPVDACAISRDGMHLAFTQGARVVVRPFNVNQRLAATPALGPTLKSVPKVAFSRKAGYRVGLFRSPSDRLPTRVFDTSGDRLERDPKADREQWIPANWWPGNPWSIEKSGTDEEPEFWLSQSGRRRGRLPIDLAYQGLVTAAAWIPGDDGRPAAVAVATDKTNNIYVFRLVNTGVCPLLRQFRGHASPVSSIGISADAKYMVSSSADVTVRIWPLRDWASDDKDLQRWGVTWREEANQLIVDQLRSDGPLRFRGVRVGDRLAQIRWKQDNRAMQANTPQQMRAALRQVPANTLMLFRFERRGADPVVFQIFPAWNQLASLLVTDEGEWAYWSPFGYYDASFQGHKLFGWQVNRGLQMLPDFFLAAQLRQRLERPEIMRRLLQAGSLDRAFQAARLDPPADSHRVLADQAALKPAIAIVSPRADAPIVGNQVRIRAEIRHRYDQQLVAPRAFANGVSAGQGRMVSQQQDDDQWVSIYEWEARLPHDPRLKLQVFAATEEQVAESAEIVVERQGLGPAPRARLFVAAAGVNQYRDAGIQDLDYAAANASALAQTWEQKARTLYSSQFVSLRDDNVTRPLWRVSVEHLADRLRQQVRPDDLLVIFLSGHGIQDDRTGDYYYVAADATLSDVKSGRYNDCLAFSDLAAFADIPCRKLVILDTCHSGAIQGDQQLHRDLKAAVRALQDDVVLTVTASTGNQEAVEVREQQLGRFTSHFLDALRGAADGEAGQRDGVVMLHEAIRYVQRTVPQEAAGEDIVQHPTAGPRELLDFVRLPLTTAGQ